MTCPRCGRLTSGAAPLPPQVTEDFEQRLPHVEIGEGYGCTETAAIISTSPLGQARRGQRGPARAGRRGPDRAAGRLRRPARARTARSACAAPMLMTGYWNAEQETAQAMRGGWLHTGDVGRLDATATCTSWTGSRT